MDVPFSLQGVPGHVLICVDPTKSDLNLAGSWTHFQHPDGDTQRLVTSGWNGIRRGFPPKSANPHLGQIMRNHDGRPWIGFILRPPEEGPTEFLSQGFVDALRPCERIFASR